eukprot:maker-scaffold632_size121914-snap-gene-0.21 protein:Tk02601 transcript:maker-scaffold632_size121914-snap-gene-0.21-mRNA-1 annotation:"---NA---"
MVDSPLLDDPCRSDWITSASSSTINTLEIEEPSPRASGTYRLEPAPIDRVSGLWSGQSNHVGSRLQAEVTNPVVPMECSRWGGNFAEAFRAFLGSDLPEDSDPSPEANGSTTPTPSRVPSPRAQTSNSWSAETPEVFHEGDIPLLTIIPTSERDEARATDPALDQAPARVPLVTQDDESLDIQEIPKPSAQKKRRAKARSVKKKTKMDISSDDVSDLEAEESEDNESDDSLEEASEAVLKLTHFKSRAMATGERLPNEDDVDFEIDLKISPSLRAPSRRLLNRRASSRQMTPEKSKAKAEASDKRNKVAQKQSSPDVDESSLDSLLESEPDSDDGKAQNDDTPSMQPNRAQVVPVPREDSLSSKSNEASSLSSVTENDLSGGDNSLSSSTQMHTRSRPLKDRLGEIRLKHRERRLERQEKAKEPRNGPGAVKGKSPMKKRLEEFEALNETNIIHPEPKSRKTELAEDQEDVVESKVEGIENEPRMSSRPRRQRSAGYQNSSPNRVEQSSTLDKGSNDAFTCKFCHFTSPSSKGVKVHQSRCHKTLETKQKREDRSQKQTEDAGASDHENEPNRKEPSSISNQVKCGHCPAKFQTAEVLVQHFKDVHRDELVKSHQPNRVKIKSMTLLHSCSLCNYKTTVESSLSTHMEQVHEKKPSQNKEMSPSQPSLAQDRNEMTSLKRTLSRRKAKP